MVTTEAQARSYLSYMCQHVRELEKSWHLTLASGNKLEIDRMVQNLQLARTQKQQAFDELRKWKGAPAPSRPVKLSRPVRLRHF
jgi:hypothetical protein